MTLFYQDKAIKLFCGDFLKVNDEDIGLVDLIVTSPPYNLGIEYDTHDDNMTYAKYMDEFSNGWLKKALDLVKSEGGRLCLNLPFGVSLEGESKPLSVDVLEIARGLGWKYRGAIFWQKMPPAGYAFGTIGNAQAPYVPCRVEVILVLYADIWKKRTYKQSDISMNDFMSWSSSIWKIQGERKTYHPAPFPLELPQRCIKLFSYEGDVVLDPFVGSGTTLLACRSTNRVGIGVDISEKYCQVSKDRLSKVSTTGIEEIFG
jgi:site-specific DNA-methyltransferase (adenine-specific)